MTDLVYSARGALGLYGCVPLAMAGIALISATSTATSVAICSVCVLFGVLVAIVAVCLPGVDGRGRIAAQSVHSASGVLKVSWVDAQWAKAQMVYRISAWRQVTVCEQERVSVSRLCSSSADELSIPLTDDACRPQPAWAKFRTMFWQRSVLVDLRPEAFFGRHRDLARDTDSTSVAFDVVVLPTHSHPLDLNWFPTSFDRAFHEGASFR